MYKKSTKRSKGVITLYEFLSAFPSDSSVRHAIDKNRKCVNTKVQCRIETSFQIRLACLIRIIVS
jgi:hypothetical protein